MPDRPDVPSRPCLASRDGLDARIRQREIARQLLTRFRILSRQRKGRDEIPRRGREFRIVGDGLPKTGDREIILAEHDMRQSLLGVKHVEIEIRRAEALDLSRMVNRIPGQPEHDVRLAQDKIARDETGVQPQAPRGLDQRFLGALLRNEQARPGMMRMIGIWAGAGTVLQYSHQPRHCTLLAIVGGGCRACVFAWQ